VVVGVSLHRIASRSNCASVFAAKTSMKLSWTSFGRKA
jgi:hypothetical protein